MGKSSGLPFLLSVSLNIISRLSKPLRIILEAAKTVVTVSAEKPTHSIGGVAVVNAQQLYLAATDHRFRLTANGADASLSFGNLAVFFWRDAIEFLEILISMVPPNLVRLFVELWLRELFSYVFYAKVIYRFIYKNEVSSWLFLVKKHPNDTDHGNNRLISPKSHYSISAARGSFPFPSSGNRSWFNIGKSRGIPPSKRQEISWIIFEKVIGERVGYGHAPDIISEGGGCNG